jgi:hypothetical protein
MDKHKRPSGKSEDEPLSGAQRVQIAEELSDGVGMRIYAESVTPLDGRVIALGRIDSEKRLLVAGMGQEGFGPFERQVSDVRAVGGDEVRIRVGLVAMSNEAARILREALPWTAPRVVGLTRSVGLGDRLGLATPGHIRAVRGSGCVPFLAQQSIREMTRTQRTPAQVMDDATWGVFQEGWRDGFGSDADHLKEPADIDTTDAVGFTMFTIDPGDHVRSNADTMDADALDDAMAALDWTSLEISDSDFRRTYLDRPFELDRGETVTFDNTTLARAAIKYSGAIAHTVRMFRHLKSRRGRRPFELEVSVDETATPTTVPEHYLIAAELKRMGVEWVSLAPRFIGEFEKGIDYKGDLGAFEREYARHAAIARTLGPYKLSLHSGSDKFSVYPIAARLSGELVHLKTAGTSYLEALRVAARVEPDLFRRILAFAFERLEEDRASYHISARIEQVPQPDTLKDDQLEGVLNGNDGRQLLHVTYGSVLTATDSAGRSVFRDDLMTVLADHEEAHYDVLADHLGRHVRPFAR